MDTLKYCFICIIALMLIFCIREYESRFAFFLRIAVAIGFAAVCASMFSVLYEYINTNAVWVSASEESKEIFTVMLKATGISFIGCISSALCRDSGENGIANSLETFCKLEIIMLCLPIINIIIEKIQNII